MSCPLQFLKLLYTGIEYQSLSVQTNLLLIPLHVQSKLRKIHGLFKKQNGNQGLFKAAQAHEITVSPSPNLFTKMPFLVFITITGKLCELCFISRIILLIKHNSHSFPVIVIKTKKAIFVKRLGLGDTVGVVYLTV